mmetsp:Transcript_17245/g.40001  ORF Transcript_17245/g.40001 Transcript_17245/m.40001 type:complete len:140 (-) Transcript_17245:1214-1633(-)
MKIEQRSLAGEMKTLESDKQDMKKQHSRLKREMESVQERSEWWFVICCMLSFVVAFVLVMLWVYASNFKAHTQETKDIMELADNVKVAMMGASLLVSDTTSRDNENREKLETADLGDRMANGTAPVPCATRSSKVVKGD